MAKILSNSGNKKRKIKAKGSNVQGGAVSLLGNDVFFSVNLQSFFYLDL